jgi:hypothetical protein
MSKQIRLNAFDMNCVAHQSSGMWRHPEISVKVQGSKFIAGYSGFDLHLLFSPRGFATATAERVRRLARKGPDPDAAACRSPDFIFFSA